MDTRHPTPDGAGGCTAISRMPFSWTISTTTATKQTDRLSATHRANLAASRTDCSLAASIRSAWLSAVTSQTVFKNARTRPTNFRCAHGNALRRSASWSMTSPHSLQRSPDIPRRSYPHPGHSTVRDAPAVTSLTWFCGPSITIKPITR